jgi:L-alanine-DL-glutamate epimerase-like enolase superfamily enzyme
VPPTPDASALAARLAALPLVVEHVRCRVAPVAVPTYPSIRRPSSIVTLLGAGTHGSGEHVGWTDQAHARFRRSVLDTPRGRASLGDWIAAMRERMAEPYDRAALEAAAIDLALHQHATNLFVLAGVAAPSPVRYVVSFARTPDPGSEAGRHPAIELKIDADPGWDDAVYAGLAALGRVAVLDFKGTGRVADHLRAHRALPDALLEDPTPDTEPWPPTLLARLSVDAPMTSADALDALPVRPAAVNVKPARMGGVLEALACIGRCTAAGIAVYLGGMFETGVGRAQLRTLASLFAADGPNDIAPLLTANIASRPSRLVVDGTRPGFGDGAC